MYSWYKNLIFFIFLVSVRLSLAQQLTVIPYPQSVSIDTGYLYIGEGTEMATLDFELKEEVIYLNEAFKSYYGFSTVYAILSRNQNYSDNYQPEIRIYLEPEKFKNDGYELVVESYYTSITASTKAGVFYGMQTLLQLMEKTKNDQYKIPCCKITDEPRFEWRGMHLDVCRHFFDKEFVKKYIDLLALHKMNVFHWHLTDDQGWRIEIKKYPRLTEVGAWRNGSMVGPYSNHKIDTVRYGGFYTQEDIKEIVKYASERHITVVPEIEMPGHALAALASYPELSCTGGTFEVCKEWGVFDDVFCAGNEKTFEFMQNVLDEVCTLFPGKYIHVGGDECPKTRWSTCPKCQQRKKENNLKDEHELQSYFIQRIEKYLNTKGKQIIGWDEILEGGLAPNAAVMSWRGTEGGIAAARQKHKAVMTPGSHCYFDHYQGNPDYEPHAIGGYTPVEKVYAYEPVPAELNYEEAKYIMGAQANIWTEYITTSSHVEYMALPRMCALAEVLWTKKEKRNWNDFLTRLMHQTVLFDQRGYNYANSLFNVDCNVSPAKNGVSLSFSTKVPGTLVWFDQLDIKAGNRFTDSTTFKEIQKRNQYAITTNKSFWVKYCYASPFAKKTVETQTMFWFTISKSTSKKINFITKPHEAYSTEAFTLVDGQDARTDRSKQGWVVWNSNEVEMVIDFEEITRLKKIKLHSMHQEQRGIYFPLQVMVSFSDDGMNFKNEKTYDAEKKWDGYNKLLLKWKTKKARYLKLKLKGPEKVVHALPWLSETPWIFLDEIEVY